MRIFARSFNSRLDRMGTGRYVPPDPLNATAMTAPQGAENADKPEV